MEIILYILVGFAAQMVDGTLGMGYGVSSTMFLLSTGLSPLIASASVHTAKTVTTLVSGVAHYKLGNVDRKLLYHLVIAGVIGGVIGAVLLSNLHWDSLQVIVSVYLLVMGLRIVYKGLQKDLIQVRSLGNKTYPLGFVGGFMDSIGGGGWGPIVTTTLVADSHHATHIAIGTVSLAEFFVSLAQVATFTIFLKMTHLEVIIGLIIGGVIAAPLAAYICKKVNTQLLMVLVGLLIVILSLRTIWIFGASQGLFNPFPPNAAPSGLFKGDQAIDPGQVGFIILRGGNHSTRHFAEGECSGWRKLRSFAKMRLCHKRPTLALTARMESITIWFGS